MSTVIYAPSMDETTGTGWVLDYDIDQRRDGWWEARRLTPITRAHIYAGVRRWVLAPTFAALKAECVAQTVAARWLGR